MVDWGDFLNPKLIFIFIIYISVFVSYYFKGLKSTVNGKTDYNDFLVFLIILLYVYNGYSFYYFYKERGGITKMKYSQVFIHVGLFYIFNIILLWHYFDPLQEDKPPTQFKQTESTAKDSSGNIVDSSGNILEDICGNIYRYPDIEIDDPSGNIYHKNKLIFFFLAVVLGFIASRFGIVALYPDIYPFRPRPLLFPFLKLLTILLVVSGLIFIIIYSFTYTPWPLTIVTSILNVGIIIGLLASIWFIFKPYLSGKSYGKSSSSWIKLLGFLIFYIPCLFIDLINYLKNQVNDTTSTSWIILVIEIILIVLRIVVPIIYKQVNKFRGVEGETIEEGPIYTSVETLLKSYLPNTREETSLNSSSDSNFILKNLHNSTQETTKFNNNYALSCDIWINPQPASTNESYSKSTSLLDYGEVLQIKFNRNKLEIFAATTKHSKLVDKLVKIYELKNIPYQKWNNFIFNYSGGTLDIFINGKLVSSTINITPIMYNHGITAGANNGIYGGIKNIIYYDRVLSKKQIEIISSNF